MIRDRAVAKQLQAACSRSALTLAGIFLAGALQIGIAAQSSASPSPATPVGPTSPVSAPSATPSKQPEQNDSKPQKPAAKTHKVFTDDDVPALRAKGGIANDDDAGSKMIYGTMGACDEDCEQEIKDRLQITPEQEGEWKLQLTAARREIGEDKQWHELYWKGQQTMRNVCGLRAQEASVGVPSGNDYQSRLERAKQQKMFEDEERAMAQQVQNNLAAINQHLQQFAAREPVRAEMMAVIAERLFDNCPGSDP